MLGLENACIPFSDRLCYVLFIV